MAKRLDPGREIRCKISLLSSTGIGFLHSECKLHIDDRGVRLGDAVYDVERTFDGKIFDLEGHIDRFYRSLGYVRIDPGLTKEEMAEITLEVVRRNDHLRTAGNDFMVRQIVTGGSAWSAADRNRPNVYVGAGYLNFKRFAHLYEQGCHVVFARTRAYHPTSVDPKVKHYSRLNFVLAELEAIDVDPGAWPVLLDHDGNISEGTTFNFGLVKDGIIYTAGDRNALQGISQNVIRRLAQDLGIRAVEGELQPYDAYSADEAFVLASSYCLLPVSKVDNRPLKAETPGPVVRRLLQAWSELVGVDIVEQARQQAGISAPA